MEEEEEARGSSTEIEDVIADVFEVEFEELSLVEGVEDEGLEDEEGRVDAW